MFDPLALLGLGPGVDRDLALSVLVRAGNRDLNRRRVSLGENQRSLQGQLCDRLGANLLGSPERQLEEGGAGQKHRATDPVVSQPRMGLQREAAGEQEGAVGSVSQLNACPQQGVIGGGEADRPSVTGAGGRGGPVALTLKGIGGQGDALGVGARKEGAPVELRASGMGVADRGRDRLCLCAPLAQGGDEGRLVLLLSKALACHRAEHRVRAKLQVGGGALGFQGRNRICEAHRLSGRG